VCRFADTVQNHHIMPPRGRKITKRNTALTAVTTAATTAATTIQNHHIMPPRGRKTTKRNTALTAVTTAATTAASTATAAAAAAINPSTRLGIYSKLSGRVVSMLVLPADAAIPICH
jgi:hypothetical protein